MFLSGATCDVSAQHVAEEQRVEDLGRLEWLSSVDPLTGLFNRRHLTDLLDSRGVNDDASSAVALIDVDFFKRINDAYGHSTGDGVLRAVARRLRAATRGSDLIARWGGEEFCVLLGDGAGRRAISRSGPSSFAGQSGRARSACRTSRRSRSRSPSASRVGACAAGSTTSSRTPTPRSTRPSTQVATSRASPSETAARRSRRTRSGRLGGVPLTALVLSLAAAVVHASWNLLLARCEGHRDRRGRGARRGSRSGRAGGDPRVGRPSRRDPLPDRRVGAAARVLRAPRRRLRQGGHEPRLPARAWCRAGARAGRQRGRARRHRLAAAGRRRGGRRMRGPAGARTCGPTPQRARGIAALARRCRLHRRVHPDGQARRPPREPAVYVELEMLVPAIVYTGRVGRMPRTARAARGLHSGQRDRRRRDVRLGYALVLLALQRASAPRSRPCASRAS